MDEKVCQYLDFLCGYSTLHRTELLKMTPQELEEEVSKRFDAVEQIVANPLARIVIEENLRRDSVKFKEIIGREIQIVGLFCEYLDAVMALRRKRDKILVKCPKELREQLE